MTGSTDFNALYSELGVGADCSIEQFKLAYRRRVSELHPDHRVVPAGTAQLQQLNRLYAAAVEFQRLHGRLPGAQRHLSARVPIESAPIEQGQSAPPPPTGAQAVPMAGSRRPARYFLSVAMVVAVLLWMRTQEGKQLALPLQAPSAGTVHPGSIDSASTVVTVGLGTEGVLAIQGTPLSAHETRWDYGPSWIDFHCGKVVDWYSSPLRPLRVDGTDSALRGKSASSDKSIRC